MQIVMRTLIVSRSALSFPAMRDLEAALQAEVERYWARPTRCAQASLRADSAGKEDLVAGAGRIALTIAVVAGANAGHAAARLVGAIRLIPTAMLALRGAALAQLKEDPGSPDPELRRGDRGSGSDGRWQPGTPSGRAAGDKDGHADPARLMLGQLGQPAWCQSWFPCLSAASRKLCRSSGCRGHGSAGRCSRAAGAAASDEWQTDIARLQAAMYLCGKGEREASEDADQRGDARQSAGRDCCRDPQSLAQSGDTAARENLLLRLNNTTNRDQQLTLASTLARIGEGRGEISCAIRRANRPGPSSRGRPPCWLGWMSPPMSSSSAEW